MSKNTFVFDLEWAEVLSEYGPEIRFEVYEAIIEYASTGTLPNLKPVANMAFSFIKRQMDYNREKYDSVVEKRRNAGRKGGLAATQASTRSSEKSEQNATLSLSAGSVEQTKQSQANEANANLAKQSKQAQDVCDTDIDIDNIFLLRVREDVPEIKKAYLDQFFGDDKQITLDRTLKNWETTREELMKVCEEVLCDWTHENIQHKTAEEAQRYFYNAVRFKFSKIKEKQNEKTGSKAQRSPGKRSSGQVRNALDHSPQPGFGLVN